MNTLYNISIFIYRWMIFIASFFNKKAKKWHEGRINVFSKFNNALREKPLIGIEKLIWFHCASLGEFEQGRSLIEKWKRENVTWKILITFFSPSGYEIRKNYPLADFVFYLPADSKSNAAKFIRAFNPSIAIFVKYEFWFNYLNELRKKNIPTYLISANFRAGDHFFKWYGGWFRNMLKMFTHVFVQNEISANLLKGLSLRNVSVSGDTRFDRVWATSKNAEEIPLAKRFKQNKKCLIAGSTWEADEKIISAAFRGDRVSDLKLIIAPHEIHEDRINSVVQTFSSFKTLRFSKANDQNIFDAEVLIIDNIGMLSRLYLHGDIAFVGGAFGNSLHNILEPAAFGLPVIFGPNHQKFWEGKALIEKGGAFDICNAEDLKDKINFLLRDEMILKIASEMSRNFVRSNTGATEKIMEEILREISDLRKSGE